jgi:TonB family protein
VQFPLQSSRRIHRCTVHVGQGMKVGNLYETNAPLRNDSVGFMLGFSFAQNTTPSTEQTPAPLAASSDKKQEPPASSSNTQGRPQADTAKVGADYGLGMGKKPTASMGPLEVLTDTMGVDFRPYLQRVLHDVRMNWYNLIPESARFPVMKKGRVTIEFAILKDGQVAGMKLVKTSGDLELDRGAWGGITGSNPFPPLPAEFGGQSSDCDSPSITTPTRPTLLLVPPQVQQSNRSIFV